MYLYSILLVLVLVCIFTTHDPKNLKLLKEKYERFLKVLPKKYDVLQRRTVITGLGPDGRGEEDLACAEYLEALLKDLNPNADSYLKRVTESRAGQFYLDPENTMFRKDIECCIDIDRFNFALEISREDDRLVMIPSKYPKI